MEEEVDKDMLEETAMNVWEKDGGLADNMAKPDELVEDTVQNKVEARIRWWSGACCPEC